MRHTYSIWYHHLISTERLFRAHAKTEYYSEFDLRDSTRWVCTLRCSPCSFTRWRFQISSDSTLRVPVHDSFWDVEQRGSKSKKVEICHKHSGWSFTSNNALLGHLGRASRDKFAAWANYSIDWLFSYVWACSLSCGIMLIGELHN